MEIDCKSLHENSPDAKSSNIPAGEEADVTVSHSLPVLHILDLPDSVIFQILMHLPFSSIGAIAQVCSRFSRISSDELLWRHVFLQHYKLPANTAMPVKAKSWNQEFKRLYYHTPAVLSEERKEHKDEVLHVSFSHDGSMFATCSKDGFFKVWECVHPVRLLFKMDMKSTFSWKFTQFSQFNETDTCLLVSGVYFGRLSTSGEIAVFNLQDDFRMQCRVTNKPYDVFGAWYDNDHLLSGTLYWTGDFNSVSAVWLSKASQEVESEVESVSMVLYRFENVNSSSIRLLHVAEVDKDSDATESVLDKEDFDGSQSAQTSPDSNSLGFGDDTKASTDASAANAHVDVAVKDQGHVEMEADKACVLDKLLLKYIAEDEFDLENEDKTDNEEEFQTHPDTMNDHMIQKSKSGAAQVQNTGVRAVPVAVTFDIGGGNQAKETDRRHCVQTRRSLVSLPTSVPKQAGDVYGAVLKDVAGTESCLLSSTPEITDSYLLSSTSDTSDSYLLSSTSDITDSYLLPSTSDVTDSYLLSSTSETTDSSMELDIALTSPLAEAEFSSRISLKASSCECSSGLTLPQKSGSADTHAGLTACVEGLQGNMWTLHSPALPFAAIPGVDSPVSGESLSLPFSASSRDIPLPWSRHDMGNNTKSQPQKLESVSSGCSHSLPKSSDFSLFDYLGHRTCSDLQEDSTSEDCSFSNLRDFGVSTNLQDIHVEDHILDVVMEDADIIGDNVPPCIIRAEPRGFSLADDMLPTSSAEDVLQAVGGTSNECFIHSQDILPRDMFQPGPGVDRGFDNRNEVVAAASALDNQPAGPRDASQQFGHGAGRDGDVSPPIVPSLLENNLVMLIPGASHVYGSRSFNDTNGSNNATYASSRRDAPGGTAFEHDSTNIDMLARDPGASHNQKSSIATQTEVASSRASSFHSLSHISQSSSLSRDMRLNPPREKLLIYTWGSETYIPHKVGIKRMKWTDFTKGEVTARRSSMLLPDVMENLHNMAGNRRDKPDVTIEMHGHIVGLSLSPDHKYLYVNCRPWPKNYIISDPQESPPLAQEVEISTIDLTTFNFVGPVLRSHKAYTHSDECFFLSLDVSEDYVASGAEDRQGYLWDRHYGIPLYRFPHCNVVNCVAVNPQDPEILVTVSDDHTFKVWMSRCRAAELTGSKEADKGTSV